MKIIQPWFLGLFLVMMMYSSIVQAQFFGFSVDGALAYSASSRGVNGTTVGITHPIPFVPNIGGTGFYFERRDESPQIAPDNQYILHSKIYATSGNLFYNIPVPIFSFLIGAGAGNVKFVTDIIDKSNGQTLDSVKTTKPMGEAFVRVGLPFFYLLDFHIGYHYISIPKLDLIKDSDIDLNMDNFKTEVDFSGGLTTLGIQIAL